MSDNPPPSTRKLIVRETKVIHSGHTKSGSPYTMWQIIATREDGIPIEENLRSFEELPTNVSIEVSIKRHDSEQYGSSFTLALTGDAKTEHGLRNIVTRLTERVEKLEQELTRLRPPQDPPAPGGPTPDPPGDKPGPGHRSGLDDDIPF